LLQHWLSKTLIDYRKYSNSVKIDFSCTLWLLYGYTANISTIIIVNFIGASLQLAYALAYLRFTPDRVKEIR